MDKNVKNWFKNGTIKKEEHIILLKNCLERKEHKRKVITQLVFCAIGVILLGVLTLLFMASSTCLFAQHNSFEFVKIGVCFLLALCSFTLVLI